MNYILKYMNRFFYNKCLKSEHLMATTQLQGVQRVPNSYQDSHCFCFLKSQQRTVTHVVFWSGRECGDTGSAGNTYQRLLKLILALFWCPKERFIHWPIITSGLYMPIVGHLKENPPTSIIKNKYYINILHILININKYF